MSDCLDNLAINLSMEKTNTSYPAHCLPSKLKKRNGKAKSCGFEEILLNHYEKEAKMIAFHTNRPRLLAWIKALEILYYDNFGNEEDFIVDWQDEPHRWTDPESPANMIVISLHSANNSNTEENSRKYQLRFFITTGTIQVQGNNVSLFVSEHFPKLKALVNLISKDSNNSCSHHVYPDQSEDEEETIPKVIFEEILPRHPTHTQTQSHPKIVITEEPPSTNDQMKSLDFSESSMPNITRVSNLKDSPVNHIQIVPSGPSVDEDNEVQININSLQNRPTDKKEQQEESHTDKPTTGMKESELKKMKIKLDFQEKMNKTILERLNRIEGNCCLISELRSDIQLLAEEKESMKARSSKIENRVLKLEEKVTDNNRQNTQFEEELKGMGLQLEDLRNSVAGRSNSSEKDNEISILKGRLEELRYEKDNIKQEQKNLLNTIKTLEKKIETKDTEINTLSKSNGELTQINENLKAEIQKLKDDRSTFAQAASETVISGNENSSVEANVSTQNSFSPLQNMDSQDIQEVDISNTDITIIADSHGRSLDPKKMYKNKNVEIKVLDARKKNLDGAAEFIQSAQTLGKETVLIVGSNDIGESSADTVFRKFRNIRDKFESKFPSCKLNIVPVLPRYNNESYNRNACVVNSKLQALASDNTSIVNLDISPDDRILFNNDNVHLSKQGNLVLVKLLKTHLNPKLGLPPYSSYSQKDRRSQPNGHFDSSSQFRSERSSQLGGGGGRRHNFNGGRGAQFGGARNNFFGGNRNLRNGSHPDQAFMNTNNLNERDILLRLLGF